jgi:hypothetical protein
MNIQENLKSYISLSLQRALLGKVFPSMRAFCFNCQGNEIDLICIVDEALEDDDKESVSFIETELLADLPPEYIVNTSIQILPLPALIPKVGTFVFWRK